MLNNRESDDDEVAAAVAAAMAAATKPEPSPLAPLPLDPPVPLPLSLPLPPQMRTNYHRHETNSDDDAHAPNRSHPDQGYLPYKFEVDTEKSKFNIFSRSEDGAHRKVFSLKVSGWCYLDIPTGYANPDKTVAILREEMSTDHVDYDSKTGYFIVEPDTAVTQRVRDVSRTVTVAPFTASSILSRCRHRFFDTICESGRWVRKPGDDEPTSMPVGICKAFRTILWNIIDDSTLAFTSSHQVGRKFVIEIWSTYDSFDDPERSSAALASLDHLCSGIDCTQPPMPQSAVPLYEEPVTESGRRGAEHRATHHFGCASRFLEVAVRRFASREEIIASFVSHAKKAGDIVVHYGEAALNSKCDDFGSQIVRELSSGPNGVNDIFDLKDYVQHVYTDMHSHDLEIMVSEIDAYATCEDAARDLPFQGAPQRSCERDVVALACATSLWNTCRAFPDMRTMKHTPENVSFFIEKIISRLYVFARLYSYLSHSAFELAFISGCNLSRLTQPEAASRGIVSFVNQIAAWSRIVDTLPRDYMDHGLHGMTHVIPLSSILIENMISSEHDLTARIGRSIKQVVCPFGWIVREIYSLSSLKPHMLQDIPSAFGFYRGMVYSLSEYPGVQTARNWSIVVNVGLGSWIGISMALPTCESRAQRTEPSVTFGYFGIDDVCRHPFDALRLAVEMFLSLKICNNSSASPHTVANAITLTEENTAMNRRVTSYNLSLFETLLSGSERHDIEANNKEIVLRVWYKARNQLTTNPLLMDRKVYVNIIELILTNTFGFLSVRQSQPQPLPHAAPKAELELAHRTAPKAKMPFAEAIATRKGAGKRLAESPESTSGVPPTPMHAEHDNVFGGVRPSNALVQTRYC